MSLDPSLKSRSSLERHRNVLSRAERIERLKELERWQEGTSPLGLPKVAHRKAAVGKKVKEKKAPEAGEEPKA
ncbi:MAG TPA: small basic protein [Phycisphaerae bacterium]|nr:small basic protein [Phycisphaerae bacterium]HNU46539.1 small basic protein [Phycisphaerae bacterium]